MTEPRPDTPTDPEPTHVTETRERIADLLDEFRGVASERIIADEIVNRLLWRWLVPDQPNATVLTEDVVQAVHTALCGECADTGTGLTVRSADLDKVRAAVAPLLAGGPESGEPGRGLEYVWLGAELEHADEYGPFIAEGGGRR